MLVPTRVSGKIIDAGETERFGVGTLPLSKIECGLPCALSVIVTTPVWLPLAEGVNVTLMAQFARGAKVAGQVFVSVYSAPLGRILLIVSAADPIFVTVANCAALVVFTG